MDPYSHGDNYNFMYVSVPNKEVLTDAPLQGEFLLHMNSYEPPFDPPPLPDPSLALAQIFMSLYRGISYLFLILKLLPLIRLLCQIPHNTTNQK